MTRPTGFPPPELWQTPLSWQGSPPRPVEDYSRGFPDRATFVRGELVFELVEHLEPGMARTTERAVPGLIELDRGKAVAVHARGLDGAAWAFRRAKGSEARWTLHAGPAFPATEPATPLLERRPFARVVVQSVVPASGSGRFIAFAIRADLTGEDLASARDPDPGDA